MLQTGIKGRIELTVTKDKCAGALGSGELDVFATPAMIALMEETAWKSVVPYLEPGEGTVGTALDVRHVAATPVGLKVICETELTLVDRRRLVFSVKMELLTEFFLIILVPQPLYKPQRYRIPAYRRIHRIQYRIRILT